MSIERDLYAQLEPLMRRIAMVFRPEMKLTLVARLPGNNEADCILTDDDPAESIKAIERRIGATSSYLNGCHDFDEDGVCSICRFDSAGFWWWRRNTHEGRESGKEMPICTKRNAKNERPNSSKT